MTNRPTDAFASVCELDADQDQRHLLDIRHLHAHYGRVCALHEVNYATHCGRAVALVGGNGAGKTTLMKAIVGLVPATTGDVYWNGKPVKNSIPEIAYLPQRQNIDWQFPITVRGLVESGRFPRLGMFRRMRDTDHHAVNLALETMQLASLADRQIGALSGGQQQRAFIARALAQEAHVLLLDEPFTGLDHPSSKSLGKILDELTKQGRLIIASHHDLNNVEELFDEVLLMNRRIIACGSPSDVMDASSLKEAYGT
jgi:ABC-type Mn2+/Zn2+ transport system ATPase subunit